MVDRGLEMGIEQRNNPNLKAIYAPKNKVDFYKEHFPADMRQLIVEEGADLPVKP